MTPEERLQKIENLLHTITENQAVHDARMTRIEEATEKNVDGIAKLILFAGSSVQWQQAADERLNRALDRLDTRFDKLEKLLERWFRENRGNGDAP